jgi:hypothetical protein
LEEKPFSYILVILLVVGLVVGFVVGAIAIFKPGLLSGGSVSGNTASATSSTATVAATDVPATPTNTVATTAPVTASATPTATATDTSDSTLTQIVAASASAAPTNMPIPTATETAAPIETPLPPNPDRAEFVTDVTVPDGTAFAEGAEFIKTWRLKNVGTTTWTTAYIFEFAGGDPMAQVTRLLLPNAVAPGETIDLSVPMKVPSGLGKKTSLFQLRNAEGVAFGVGPQYNEFIYVEVFVITSEASATSATSATP